MSEEKDYQKIADFAIIGAQRLIEQLESIIENWSNSQYCDTKMGQDVIKTCQEQIREAEEEIEAYKEYKVTGVWVSRKARKLLQKIKEEQRKNR